MAGTEVKVPDIGDFKNVEVIEVLVKPGDAVSKEQSLITLESDKATMEIPSPNSGVVKELRLKVGDKVSQGSPILLLEAEQAQKPESRKAPEAPRPVSPVPSAGADVECEVLVLGAGPGGYSAAFRAADLGLKTVLVERYPTLGGVCLNVGCIPSKALLHTAAVIDAAKGLASHGVAFGEPKLDLARLRDFKNKVVGKLTGGLASMAKLRKVTVLTGVGTFSDAHHLVVETKEGRKTVRFSSAIIAAGIGLGLTLNLLSVLLWAVYTVHLRVVAPRYPLSRLMVATFTAASVFFILMAFLFDRDRMDWNAVVQPLPLLHLALYIAFPSIIAYLLYAASIGRVGAGPITILLGVELIVTSILAHLLLNELFPPARVLGLILAGAAVAWFVWMQNRFEKRRPLPAPP
jgi:hypothetical protein